MSLPSPSEALSERSPGALERDEVLHIKFTTHLRALAYCVPAQSTLRPNVFLFSLSFLVFVRNAANV